MTCAVMAFVVLFVLPFTAVIIENRATSQALDAVAAAALLVLAIVLLPRLLRRVRLRRVRRPSPQALAGLDWPPDLTRAELEAFCVGWLRAHGWMARLGTDPSGEAGAVYILATRGASTVGIMCDQRGEDLNPAIIRAFRLEAQTLGATLPVLLTQWPGKLPHPAENAARAAGVRLLRVAELAQLDAIAPTAAVAAEPAPVGG